MFSTSADKKGLFASSINQSFTSSWNWKIVKLSENDVAYCL